MNKNFLSSSEIFEEVTIAATNKTKLTLGQTLFLAILAGGYIALGAQLFLTASTGVVETLGFGLAKVLGGLVFSIGLIMIVVVGGELFTGNSFVMAYALLNKKITWVNLLKNWVIVYFANLIGALIVVIIVYYAGLNVIDGQLSNIGQTALVVATTKTSAPLVAVFFKAILANWLVCLGVAMGVSARDIVSKMLAIAFPVMAFVTMGLEHSIANMYFLPMGLILSSTQDKLIPIESIFANIGVATLGNIFGAVIFVAGTYFLIYRQKAK